jgi:hypothetical protein
MEGPCPRRQKNHLRGLTANHKGNIKFLNSLLSRKAHQIKKEEDLLKGCLEEPSPIGRAHLKIEIAYTCYNVTNTLTK